MEKKNPVLNCSLNKENAVNISILNKGLLYVQNRRGYTNKALLCYPPCRRVTKQSFVCKSFANKASLCSARIARTSHNVVRTYTSKIHLTSHLSALTLPCKTGLQSFALQAQTHVFAPSPEVGQKHKQERESTHSNNRIQVHCKAHLCKGNHFGVCKTELMQSSACKAELCITESTTSSLQKKESNLSNQSVITDSASGPVFPFTAIVGQQEMKLALILNVIDPKIGGVMIMGDRGTGKSTTIRALVDLLPEIEVIENDPFNSDPYDIELMSSEVRERIHKKENLQKIKKKISMIDLPLGATEDRVCGTIDIEKALTEGVKAFEPGLLAKANRGILYVDEVNLLDDHLVDVLLDSAASGWNTVEREGISISHPARFILVGSGNPEEGELRPQLLDRFGMHAQIGTVKEPNLRVKIVEQRAQFDESPALLRESYAKSQSELAQKIKAARLIRSKVQIDYDLRIKVSEICSELNVDGLRGDIVTNRASQAIAAFEERVEVTPQDIFRVIPLCLRHRLRKDPLESIDSGEKVKQVFKRVFGFNTNPNVLKPRKS